MYKINFISKHESAIFTRTVPSPFPPQIEQYVKCVANAKLILKVKSYNSNGDEFYCVLESNTNDNLKEMYGPEWTMTLKEDYIITFINKENNLYYLSKNHTFTLKKNEAHMFSDLKSAEEVLQTIVAIHPVEFANVKIEKLSEITKPSLQKTNNTKYCDNIRLAQKPPTSFYVVSKKLTDEIELYLGNDKTWSSKRNLALCFYSNEDAQKHLQQNCQVKEIILKDFLKSIPKWVILADDKSYRSENLFWTYNKDKIMYFETEELANKANNYQHQVHAVYGQDEKWIVQQIFYLTTKNMWTVDKAKAVIFPTKDDAENNGKNTNSHPITVQKLS